MVKLSDLIAGMLRTVAGGCERLPTPSEHDSNPQTLQSQTRPLCYTFGFFPFNSASLCTEPVLAGLFWVRRLEHVAQLRSVLEPRSGYCRAVEATAVCWAQLNRPHRLRFHPALLARRSAVGARGARTRGNSRMSSPHSAAQRPPTSHANTTKRCGPDTAFAFYALTGDLSLVECKPNVRVADCKNC